VAPVVRLKPTRLLALGALALLAYFYWKPLHTYVHTKHELRASQAQVRALHAEQTKLQQRISQVGTGEQLVREARTLGLVKPGETLFIVKGISAWRHRNKK